MKRKNSNTCGAWQVKRMLEILEEIGEKPTLQKVADFCDLSRGDIKYQKDNDVTEMKKEYVDTFCKEAGVSIPYFYQQIDVDAMLHLNPTDARAELNKRLKARPGSYSHCLLYMSMIIDLLTDKGKKLEK